MTSSKPLDRQAYTAPAATASPNGASCRTRIGCFFQEAAGWSFDDCVLVIDANYPRGAPGPFFRTSARPPRSPSASESTGRATTSPIRTPSRGQRAYLADLIQQVRAGIQRGSTAEQLEKQINANLKTHNPWGQDDVRNTTSVRAVYAKLSR